MENIKSDIDNKVRHIEHGAITNILGNIGIEVENDIWHNLKDGIKNNIDNNIYEPIEQNITNGKYHA